MSSSATRALRILDEIGAADRPLGVTEIARDLLLPAGTVFRSLDALVRAGLVQRYKASSRYVLGPAAERLRRSLIARFRMRDAVLPYLRQLASVSGETASLHVRLGWYGVRIASAPGTAEVTNAPPLGEAHPLGAAYPGKAMLAFFLAADIARYRAWAAGGSGHPADEDRELRHVRERGFALGETGFENASAVAFPIRVDGAPIAAIAIEGPVFAHGRTEPDGLADWRAILAHVEALARTQAGLFENPFAHLHPDSILL
jgi:IclR family acetate operon transcriptional repressor